MKPKPLIAIPSCHSNADQRQACRDTWIGTWGHLIDLKFFIGRPVLANTADEIYLDCNDSYRSLAFKIRAMLQWARQLGYTNVFKCDDDTWVHIPRLLASGYEAFDYVGNSRTTGIQELYQGGGCPFGQGGAGYWLSEKAMDIAINASLDFWRYQECEDVGMGILLGTKIIPLHVDPRYRHGTVLPYPKDKTYPANVVIPAPRFIPTPENDQITAHKCQRWKLETIHERFVK
jgi:hypothetical protein